MPPQTGSFNKGGSPTVKVRVGGVIPGAHPAFEAIIDTGFTGFMSMPLLQAFPLGLILAGTTTIILADASTQPRLTAIGVTTLDGEQPRSGIIVLEPAQSDMLVGMDFLRVHGKVLTVAPLAGSVSLTDDATPPGPPPPAPVAAQAAAAPPPAPPTGP